MTCCSPTKPFSHCSQLQRLMVKTRSARSITYPVIASSRRTLRAISRTVYYDIICGSWGPDRLICPFALMDVASCEGQLLTRDARCSVGRRPWLAPSGTDDLPGLTLGSYVIRTVKVMIIGDSGVEPRCARSIGCLSRSRFANHN
jgi:hypothetical protein